MRKLALIGIVVLAGLALAPAVEAAPRAKVPSSLQENGLGYGPGEANLEGFVESERAACLRNRHIRIFAIRQNGSPKLISVDRSSLNGFWGGEGETSVPKAFRAVMKPRDLSRRKTCGGDRIRVPVPSGPGRPAAREELPTTVDLDGGQLSPTFVSTDGVIQARRACRSKRRVDLLALTTGEPELVDFDRASRNGYFGGGGPTENANGIRALAPAKNIRGPHTCAEGSDAILFL
jgi:hypothetical protein